MLQTLKNHFSKAEFVSVIQTFIAIAVLDCVTQWNVVVGGNWSKPALFALLGALGRSLLKAIWTVLTTQSNLSPNSTTSTN